MLSLFCERVFDFSFLMSRSYLTFFFFFKWHEWNTNGKVSQACQVFDIDIYNTSNEMYVLPKSHIKILMLRSKGVMDKITNWVCDKIFTQKKKRDMWQDDSLYKLFIVFLEEQQIRTYKTKLTTKKKLRTKITID